MRPTVVASLVILCLLVSSSGQARRSLTVSLRADTETETAVSGARGPISGYIGEIPGDGMRGVGWFEQADMPCRFDSYMRNLDNGADTSTGRYWSTACHNYGSEKKVILANAREFVRGIAVCDNGKSNHRVKGIRLYRAKVWKTKAQIDAVSPAQSVARTSCKTWKKAVYCPTGKVATEFVLYSQRQYNLSATANAVQGIALKCQQVVWT